MNAAEDIDANNSEAVAEIYRELHPRVLRLCHYLLGSREEAEDAADEVFVRLPRAMKTYDRAQPLTPWLSSLTRHYCVDLLRRRRSERRVLEFVGPDAPEPAAAARSPLEALLSVEEAARVRAALARLPERYRVPLVLRYYRELSYQEVAQEMGIARATAAVLIFRAKGQLRRILARKERERGGALRDSSPFEVSQLMLS